MKIITRLQLVSRLLVGKKQYPFSNFLKDSPLSLQDLVSQRTHIASTEPSSKQFNISPSKKSKSGIDGNSSSEKQLGIAKHETLQLIDKAFSMRGESKNYHLCFDNGNSTQQERIQSAVQFMKYLDHSLEKLKALEVIQMIEKFCHRRMQDGLEQSTRGSFLSKASSLHEKEDSQLFKGIRDHLVHNLNFYTENVDINNDLISSLLDFLAHSDPSHITLANYEQECISIDEDERAGQPTGKNYFQMACGSRYFEESQTSSETANSELPKPEENKYKLALEEAFQLKDRTKFSKLYLKKMVVEQSKVKQLKVRVADDKVIFHKKNVEKTIVTNDTKLADQRSAYLYELPFSITDTEAQDFIQYLQKSKNIKVESFVLFPYKNFIEKNHQDVIFKVSDRYTEKNVHIEKVVKTIDIDELTKYREPSKTAKRSKKSQFDDVPLENEPNRRKSVTEALLLKIKKESYSKFNKSSMLVKFASKDDKEKVLNQQSRLFGLNYSHFRNVKFQEGFCKTSISVTGIPWGCPSKQLERHLNKILEPEKIPIKVEENCILTKSAISIQFDHLSEAFLAIQKLNNLTFQNKTLRAHLSYGSCKLFKSQYNINLQQSYDMLKQKIQLSGASYERKYQEEESKSSQ